MNIEFPKEFLLPTHIDGALDDLCAQSLPAACAALECPECAFYSKDNFLEAIKEKGIMHFSSDDNAKNFMEWLDNSGEQAYMDAMDDCGLDAVTFDYDYNELSIECVDS